MPNTTPAALTVETRPARARYTDAEKALGLAACALFAPDYEAAADALATAPAGFAVPAETLRNWHSKGRGVNADALAGGAVRAEDMAETARAVAELALGCAAHVLEDAAADLERMRAQGVRVPAADGVPLAERLAKVAAVAVDKHQLLTGGATERTESRALSLHAVLTARANAAPGT